MAPSRSSSGFLYNENHAIVAWFNRGLTDDRRILQDIILFTDKLSYNLKMFDHQLFFLYYINGIQYHHLDSIIMQEDFVIKEMMFDTPKTKKARISACYQ